MNTKCGFACLPGFADCNFNAADGCEQDIDNDPRACGRCGNFCHGECVRGVCHAHWDGEQTVVAISDVAPPFSQDSWELLWLRTDGGTLDLRALGDGLGTPDTLQSVPLASGARPLLTQDNGFIYFTNGGTGDAGVLYLAAAFEPEILASGIDAPGGIQASGDTVYWTSPSTGEVLQTERNGNATRVVASGQDRPGPLAMDSRNLYWVNQGSPR
jgi:hypothetical protein